MTHWYSRFSPSTVTKPIFVQEAYNVIFGNWFLTKFVDYVKIKEFLSITTERALSLEVAYRAVEIH